MSNYNFNGNINAKNIQIGNNGIQQIQTDIDWIGLEEALKNVPQNDEVNKVNQIVKERDKNKLLKYVKEIGISVTAAALYDIVKLFI